MPNAKRIICLLLALVLCVSVAACGKPDNSSDEVYVSERKLDESKDESGDAVKREFSFEAKDFASLDGYTVIYPAQSIQLRKAAQKLVAYFEEQGIKLSVSDDTAGAKDKEIILGDTTRGKSTLAENKYAVSVVDDKIFFESGNFNGVIKAVSWFVSTPYKKGKINIIKGEYDFASEVERPDGKYTFVWGDEFDGDTLDEEKWGLSARMSAESNFKLSRDPAAIRVEDGNLKLSALRWFDPDNNQIQAIVPFTVESKEYMNFQYGYLEMRAKIPFRAGAWPSLWLSGACSADAVVSNLFPKGDIKPTNFSAEFDIVEYTSLQPNLHKWFYDDANVDNVKGVVNKHSSLGAVEAPVKSDLRLDPNQSYVYQTVGFDWTPKEMVVYINGEEFYRYNWKESVQLDGLNDMTDFHNPAFIRINNHLEPKNLPADFSTLPADYHIDYIRLYQKTDTGGIWLAE